MKKLVLIAVSLLALAVQALAQMSPTPAAPSSTTQADMSAMTQMMEQCTNMMSMMQMMGQGANMMPIMGERGTKGILPDSVLYDEVAAEALARAFLSGRSPATLPIVIEQIVLSNNSYTVSYQKGVGKGTLTVDAMTGEVIEQP